MLRTFVDKASRIKPDSVFGSLAIASLICGALLATRLADDAATWWGLFGVGLTAASGLIAILIFFTQARASSATENRITSTLLHLIAPLITRQISASESASQADTEPDLFPADYARLGVPIPGTEHVRVLEPSEVPLKLVRDLVVGWEADEKQGRWNVGELRLAFRRMGRGNHSWFLLFERGAVLHLFQVSRGGRGNTAEDIHVRRVELEWPTVFAPQGPSTTGK